MRTFTKSIGSLWKTSFRKDMPERWLKKRRCSEATGRGICHINSCSIWCGVFARRSFSQQPVAPGPRLGILLMFRQYPIALVADIEGMFNQVKVPPADSDALRFLWWEDSDLERPSEFQMTSHIFGATDSPSCANFCLKRAAEARKGRFGDEAVRAVDKDFYLDDFETSVRTVTEASSLAGEVTCLPSEAGFRLTKTMSNSR